MPEAPRVPSTARHYAEAVFQLAEGRLLGCVAVNRYADLAAARRLISAGIGVTGELLRSPDLDLREWSQQAVEAAGGATA